MNTQYKKGVLELLVLNYLRKKDYYGYDISDTLSKNMQISAGTVYPILRKLKNEGYLSTYLKEASNGPARKYYTITKSGLKRLKLIKKEWTDFVQITQALLED